MSITIKTMAGWREHEANDFDGYVKPYDEISEDVYWYFLEVLPPTYCSNGFLVSEAYSYCDKHNTQTYGCFVKVEDSFYYLGNISPLAVDDELEKLANKGTK